MLDYGREAMDIARPVTRRQLDTDRLRELALTRLVGIVGEAATRVSPETRLRCPDIPWAVIVGLRNRLTHGYDAINLDIPWSIPTDDLPPLVAEWQRILDDWPATSA